jgi:hypothetical protein
MTRREQILREAEIAKAAALAKAKADREAETRVYGDGLLARIDAELANFGSL